MALPKLFKGDKYIYLLMAYQLALTTGKENDFSVSVGVDNGMIGGQNFWRRFSLHNFDGRTILQEKKSSRAFADYSKYYEITHTDKLAPTIKEYINEDGENCSLNWTH